MLFRSSFFLSVDNQRELAGTDENRQVVAQIGRDLPRLETVDIGGKSWGPLVAEWAERHLGVQLMGWQKRAVDGMLMLDPDTNDLHFRESLVSTARQNGKSVLLQAVVGWMLTEGARLRGRPLAVLSVANRLDRAEEIGRAHV